MKITLVQSRGFIDDLKVNFFKARMRINNVDSDIFVFPEMFCSGYVGDRAHMHLDKIRQVVLDGLCKLSDNRGSTIICGCPEEDGSELYNKALVIDGMEISSYSKINLSGNMMFDETQIFKSGSSPMIVSRQGLRMGLAVGRDLFVEDLVRFYAENKADMIICISALLPEQMDRFLLIARSYAAQYSIPIMVCNMTGPDCGKELAGRSAYIDQNGEFLETCTAGSDVREIRIDVEALNANTESRVIPPKVELSGCSRIEVKNTEADPNGPLCPFSM